MRLPDTPDTIEIVPPERFRQAFRRMASTVGVVTYRDQDGITRGMTATSHCALSATPPSLLVCVERSTRTHAELTDSTTFGLELLADDQSEIAEFCARRGAEKILPPDWMIPVDADAAPRLRGVLAHFDCVIERLEPAFTHSIVIARIRSIGLEPEERGPLIHREGMFHSLPPDA